MTLTREQLLHLADRARRGALLPDEGALLATEITVLLARLDDQDAAADVAVRAIRVMNRAGAERDRYRLAWKSARARVKRGQRAQAGELRHANAMWSHALRDLHRYRAAWKSARHRAALYIRLDAARRTTDRFDTQAQHHQCEAEDTLERVRAVAAEWGEPYHCGWLSASVLVRQLLAALDQAQQPTT